MIVDLSAMEYLCHGLSAIGRASLQGGIALLLVWIISRIWVRMPATARVWIWRIAYLKLIISLCWAGAIILPFWSTPINRSYSPIHNISSKNAAPIDLHQAIIHDNRQSAIKSSNRAWLQADTNDRTMLRRPHKTRTGGYFWTLSLLWAIGVCWGGIRLLLARNYAYQLRQACRLVEQPEVRAVLAELVRQMRMRRSPTLLIGNDAGPMLSGVFNPSIILPAKLLELYNSEELCMVLAHELAHLRRRDLFWNWLPILAEILFFFHPLVWVAAREIQLAQEIACDEMALRLTKAAKSDYAGMLIDTAAQINHSPNYASIAVGVSESYSMLSRRLKAIYWHRGATRIKLLIVGMLMVLLGLALAVWRVTPGPHNRGDLTDLVVSADGSRIALSYRGGIIEVIDYATGKLEHLVECQSIDGVVSMAFSSDSKSLFFSEHSSSWRRPTHPFYRLDINRNTVERMPSDANHFWISQNGNMFWTDIAGSMEMGEGPTYLVLRSLHTGTDIHKLPPLKGNIGAISEDGKMAITNYYKLILAPDRTATGYRNASLILWDLTNGKQISQLYGRGTLPSEIAAFSPDGGTIAACEQELGSPVSAVVRVWNTKSGKAICALAKNSWNVRKIRLSPDGKKLAVLDMSGEVTLWDTASSAANWVWHGKDVGDLAFNPNGTAIIIGANRAAGTNMKHDRSSGQIIMLGAKTGRIIRMIYP